MALRSPTEDDLRLLDGVLGAGVDAVAVSFVHTADDVATIRRVVGSDGPMVVAKIETGPAVADLDDILHVADGVMVARGDLGVRLPLEDVPHIQKQIIRTGVAHGKPVITATQMLESMITAPTPTRAEVSDVANAVFDGTSAVMLSAETAIGVDPVAVVDAMARITTPRRAGLRLPRLGHPAGRAAARRARTTRPPPCASPPPSPRPPGGPRSMPTSPRSSPAPTRAPRPA